MQTCALHRSSFIHSVLLLLHSEDAVEHDELSDFLRLNEPWEEYDLDGPSLSVKPIGVPGASSPQQMTNQKPSYSTSPAPSPLKNKDKGVAGKDAGTLLEDTTLDGVDVTDDDLEKLVMELGLGGEEAEELVKGLTPTLAAPATATMATTAAPVESEVEPLKVKTHDEPGNVVVSGKIVAPGKEAAEDKVVDVEPVKAGAEVKIDPKVE